MTISLKAAITLAAVMSAGYTDARIEQQSAEWHAWRAGGLGASSVPTIVGENPWQTPYQYWAEKCGFIAPKDLSGNPHIRRGVENEDAAREAWEARHNEFTMPLCIESNYASWLRVSYDGITSKGEILEIKCPSPKKIAWLKERWTEGVVVANYEQLERLGFGHYYGQCQYQMAVAGAAINYLWIWDVEAKEGYEIIVPLNEEYTENLLVEAEKFWQMIQDVTPPELDPKRDVLNVSLLEKEELEIWNVAEQQYIELESQIKALEKQVKALKESQKESQDALVSLAGIWPKVESPSGFKLTTFTKKGTVDYSAALAELAPQITENDLNRFRKDPSTGVRITVPKS